VGRLTQWDQSSNRAGAEWSTQRAQYGYNDADELTSAVRTTGQGEALGQSFWGYDSAGNRLSDQRDGTLRSWNVNGFNQLTQLNTDGMTEVRGLVSVPATITIAGQAATMDGLQWSARLPLSAGSNQVPIQAQETEGANGGTPQTVRGYLQLNIPETMIPYSYDANGNLLNDGERSYEWDAENRLAAVSGAWGRSEFTYDGISRRVRIIEKNSGGAVTAERHFGWEGLSIVEERNNANAVVKRFWSKGEQRFAADNSEPAVLNLFYTRDHLGSLRELVDQSGVIRAIYQYDDWGNRTKPEGDLDADFGYTGHFEHAPSGLTLAPYRGYNARLGRWLSRDPIKEEGGINLYGYVGNSPTKSFDPTGECAWVLPEISFEVGLLLGGALVLTPQGQRLLDAIGHAIYNESSNTQRGAGSNLPTKGTPNSSGAADDGKGGGTIRDYGPDGNATTDYDVGHDYEGAGDPHAHDWNWTGPKPVRCPARPLKPGE
jgi:RHS repeat-associated protein